MSSASLLPVVFATQCTTGSTTAHMHLHLPSLAEEEAHEEILEEEDNLGDQDLKTTGNYD